jgi:hypothetical protein
MDCPIVHDPSVMQMLRGVATETNRQLAAQLGINQSAAITTVKPSGNSSQLLNCSSGLHARWAPYYERNVRVATTSPIFKVLRAKWCIAAPIRGRVGRGSLTPYSACARRVHDEYSGGYGVREMAPTQSEPTLGGIPDPHGRTEPCGTSRLFSASGGTWRHGHAHC